MLAAGVLIGLACGVKWSPVYFAAGFLVLSVLWDRAARRSAGARRSTAGATLRDLPGAAVSLLVVPTLAYLATWTGWLLSETGYNRHWADSHPAQWDSLKLLRLGGGAPFVHLRLEPSRWPILPGTLVANLLLKRCTHSKQLPTLVSARAS